MLLTSQTAAAGERASPLDYRYAGVVETGVGIPARTITTGRGVLFSFYDSFSQGRKEEPYQLCVGPPGKAPAICWKRTASGSSGVWFGSAARGSGWDRTRRSRCRERAPCVSGTPGGRRGRLVADPAHRDPRDAVSVPPRPREPERQRESG